MPLVVVRVSGELYMHNLGTRISLLLRIVLAHVLHGLGSRNSFGDDSVGLAVRNKIPGVFYCKPDLRLEMRNIPALVKTQGTLLGSSKITF